MPSKLVTNIERPQRKSMCTSLDRLDGSIFGPQHPLFAQETEAAEAAAGATATAEEAAKRDVSGNYRGDPASREDSHLIE